MTRPVSPKSEPRKRSNKNFKHEAIELWRQSGKNRRDFPTHQQARHGIFAYIETRYNRKRPHSSLDYVSPIEFENNSTDPCASN